MYAQHSPAPRGPSEMRLLNIVSGRKGEKKQHYLTRTHLSKPLKRFLYQQINDGKNLVLGSCKKRMLRFLWYWINKTAVFLVTHHEFWHGWHPPPPIISCKTVTHVSFYFLGLFYVLGDIRVIAKPFWERGVKKQAQMYFHRFDNAASFLRRLSFQSSPRLRFLQSPAFAPRRASTLVLLPVRSLPVSVPASPQSRPAVPKMDRPGKRQQSGSWSKTLCPPFRRYEVIIRCSQGFNKSLYNNRHSVPAPRCQ